MSDPWDDDARVDGLVLDSITASGGQAVDLPTILDRIDGSERMVFSHSVLDTSLRRLSDRGLIRVLEDGSFVDARRSTAGVRFDGLTAQTYKAGVRAYHASFASDAAAIMRMPMLRGIAPPALDMDMLSIQYEIESVIASSRGRISRPSIREGVIRLPIRDLDKGTDRGELVQQARARLMRAGFGHRQVVLRFVDRRDELVAGG